MGNSLGDQFLKAGLVSKEKVNKAKKARYKKQKAARQDGQTAASETTEAARKAASDKAARDRELNLKRKQAADRKAQQAQTRQLIERNLVPIEAGDLAHHFQDGKLVKTLYLTSGLHDRLRRGLLVIVRHEGAYELVPADVAEKIRERDADSIIGTQAEPSPSGADKDPYADFKVPDDLMW